MRWLALSCSATQRQPLPLNTAGCVGAPSSFLSATPPLYAAWRLKRSAAWRRLPATLPPTEESCDCQLQLPTATLFGIWVLGMSSSCALISHMSYRALTTLYLRLHHANTRALLRVRCLDCWQHACPLIQTLSLPGSSSAAGWRPVLFPAPAGATAASRGPLASRSSSCRRDAAGRRPACCQTPSQSIPSSS